MLYNQQSATENSQSRPRQARMTRLQSRQPHRRQQSSSSMTSTSKDLNNNTRGTHEHGTSRQSVSQQRSLEPPSNRMIPPQEQSQGRKGSFKQIHQFLQHPHPQQSSMQYHPGMQANYRQLHHSTMDPSSFSVPPHGFHMQQSDSRAHRLADVEFSKRTKSKGFPHDKRNNAEHVPERVHLTADYGGKKARQNPEFTIPKSSLDNLLGIDATEMYNSVPVGPRHSHRPMMRGLVGRQTEQSDKAETVLSMLSSFQQSCIRSLASMIVCPHTILPITVGLFNRSFMMEENIFLQALSEEISNRMASNPHYQRNKRIEFTMCTSLLPLLISMLLGYILGLALGWQLGIAVAVTALIIYIITVCIIVAGIGAKKSTKSARFAETVSRYMRGCNLILNILFYRAPPSPSTAQPVRLLPISLNLADCVSGVDAAALMTEKLWQFAELKYGKLAVRMQWASKDSFSDSVQTFRKFCCLPLWFWLATSLLTTLTMATLLAVASSPGAEKLPAQSVTKSPPSNQDSETQAIPDGIHDAAIVCGVFAALSFLVLCAASMRSLFNLLQGRPFQHKRQRLRYKTGGKLGEPPMDMCYAVPGSRFDPMACVRVDNYCNARYNPNATRPSFHLNSELTSAATVAAAAAAAAVTAAANQKWHLFDHSQHRINGNSIGGKKRSTFEQPRLETSDLESQASLSSTSDEEVDDESENSDKAEDEDVDTQSQFQNNVNLCESGELLLKRDQKHGKGTKVNNGKHSGDKRSKKSNAETQQNLSKWKRVIRKGLLEVCKVLSLIDTRMGNRQTRIILCITGTGCPTSPTSTILKLATFVRLVDRLLMQPPEGGTSGDVVVMLEPSHKKALSDKNERKSSSASKTWTPNVIVLVTASVPSSFSVASNQLVSKSREPSNVLMSQHPFPWANFKLWWSVHHFCHLPLYLEDEPLGSRINEPTDSQPIASAMFPMQTTQYLPSNSNLLDVYAGIHELADLNTKYLRQLLTMSAFMGRMINIDRISVEQQGMVRIAAHALPGSVNYLPTLAVLVTWLCLIQHWPFHAAWLALFIEEHFRNETEEGAPRSHDTISFGQSRGRTEETTNSGQRTPQTDPLHWNSDLSQLHNRVLRRLAPAVETARQKALSASIGTMHSGMDFPNRQLASYPPHVMSTLDICDLALRDRDPRRLARFLRSSTAEMNLPPNVVDPTNPVAVGFAGQMNSLFQAGHITVGQLLRVMKLTPFLNPQISQWIKDVLLTKVNMSESMAHDKSGHGTPADVRSQSLDSSKRISTAVPQARVEEADKVQQPSMSAPNMTAVCRVKLKHGLPKKHLSQMTIDDVCNLLKDIEDLSANQPPVRGKATAKLRHTKPDPNSTGPHQPNRKVNSSDSETPVNDPVPPAPTTAKASRTVTQRKKPKSIGKYEDRIRRLNITGNVLTLCSMDELQKELAMSFGDWKLFSTVIGYLRSCDPSFSGDVHRTTLVQGHSGSAYLYQSQSRDHSEKAILKDRQNIFGTVSDTSIALTIKSAPLSEEAHPVNSFNATPKPAKSMISLTSTQPMASAHRSSIQQRGKSVERTFDQLPPTAQPRFCHRHSLKALEHQHQQQQNMAAALQELPSTAFCPRHQEQVRRLVRQASHQQPKDAYTEESQLWASKVSGQQHTPGLDTLGHRSLPRVHTCGYHRAKHSANEQLHATQLASTSLERLPPSISRPTRDHGAVVQPSTSQQPGNQLEDKHQRHRVNGVEGTSTYGHSHQGGETMFQKHTVGYAGHVPDTRQMKGRSPGTHTHACRERPSTLLPGLYGAPQTLSANMFTPGVIETIQRDSASTSLAGEMAEEVAEISPAHMKQQDIVDKRQGQLEGSDSQSNHSCDCNYWYSLEGSAAAPNNVGHQSIEGSVLRAVQPCVACHSPAENSISDSLSTTRSQLEASSGSTAGCTSTGSSLDRIDRIVS